MFTPAGQAEAFFLEITKANAMAPTDPAFWLPFEMHWWGHPLNWNDLNRTLSRKVLGAVLRLRSTVANSPASIVDAVGVEMGAVRFRSKGDLTTPAPDFRLAPGTDITQHASYVGFVLPISEVTPILAQMSARHLD